MSHYFFSFVYEQLYSLGLFVVYLYRILKKIILFRFSFRLVFEQFFFIGVHSLFVTFITSIFVGMAFTFQVVKEFVKFGAGAMVGGIVGMAIWRELGPMMTGAVIAGRVGAAIAAEIGTMKVTEQVDALKAMTQDSLAYLVIPRVLALTVVMPLLIVVADVMGYFSGFFIAYGFGDINPTSFFNSTQNMLNIMDILGGLIKGGAFWFQHCCYFGLLWFENN